MTTLALLVAFIAVNSALSAWEKQAYRRAVEGFSLEDKGRLFDANFDNGNWSMARVPGLMPLIILLPLIASFFDVLRPYWIYCFAAAMAALLVLLALNDRATNRRLKALPFPESFFQIRKRIAIVTWSMMAVFMAWLIIDYAITHG